MAGKYTTLAFSARDVQELYVHLREHIDGLTTLIRLAPTAADPLRLVVSVSGFLRQVRIGESARCERIVYVPSTQHDSIDKTIFQALWALSQEIEAPPDLWGTYTELAPGFLPRPQR
jgi:hypothetical protein